MVQGYHTKPCDNTMEYGHHSSPVLMHCKPNEKHNEWPTFMQATWQQIIYTIVKCMVSWYARGQPWLDWMTTSNESSITWSKIIIKKNWKCRNNKPYGVVSTVQIIENGSIPIEIISIWYATKFNGMCKAFWLEDNKQNG